MTSNTTAMHPRMREYWRRREGIVDDEKIRRAMDKRFAPYLDNPVFLGSGAEGAVYREGMFVKKFIMNWFSWSKPNLTFDRLSRLASRMKNPHHLYSFTITYVEEDVLLVSYPYRDTFELDERYVRSNWHSGLCFQYLNMVQELWDAGFCLANPKLHNLRMDGNVLKLIDYGGDCLPIEMAQKEIARMFFMLLNNVYDLGRRELECPEIP